MPTRSDTSSATGIGSDPFASVDPAPVGRWSRFRPPSGRALVGGLLVALAAAGVLSAHRAAGAPPTTRYLVLTDEVAAGTPLSAEHLGSIALDLPDEVAAIAEQDASEVLGRVTRTGLAELDLLRPGDLYERGRFVDPDAVEVALELPAPGALLGAIRPGDRVEVLATDPTGDGTVVVATADVVDPGDQDPGGIGASSTVTVRLSLADREVATQVVDAAVRTDVTLTLPAPLDPEVRP